MTDFFLSGVLAPLDGALEPRVFDSLGFSQFLRRVCVIVNSKLLSPKVFKCTE